MDHLTDTELIDYTLKFDTDPIRVRLAGVMDRMPGAILDSLEDAGMDPVWCTFENTYDPGQYIRHLENEIEFLSNELQQAQEEVANLKARTVLELIAELRQELHTMDYTVRETNKDRMKAVKERDEMKSKLSMWAKLNADPGSNLL
jgi:hypothetical protein